MRLDSHLWLPSSREPDLQRYRIPDPRWDPDAGSYQLGISPWIEPWIRHESEIGLERGLTKRFLKDYPRSRFRDNRCTVPVQWPPYQGPELRPAQRVGINRGVRAGSGILILPTGAGKTLTVLELARRLGQRTLVIAPRNGLAEQWVDEAKQKFDIPLSAIGRISDGCRNIGSILTTAHPQSLITSGAISGLERVFGTVVLDECQYGGADSYRSAVTAFHARYRIGTSANPSRQDGIEKLIHAIFGPVLIRREREESERVGSVLPVMLRVVPYNSHRILPRGVANRERALLQDPDRTGVLDWVVETAPKPALIVCRLRESVDILQKRYNEQAPFQGRVGRMVGQRTRVDRDEFASAMAGLPSGAMDLAVATWSACGVGTNIPGLRSLIMATPPGRGERGYLAYNQNRGRASRLAPDKERGEIYLLWDRSRVRGVATQCWEWNDRQGEIWTGTGWKRVGEWDLVG